jgi:hypothetical protein
MKTFVLMWTILLAAAAPAVAQVRPPIPPTEETPPVAVRALFFVSGEQMSAKTSFDAIFGQSFEPFYGGGVNLVFRHGIWVEATASHFSKTGQRAFINQGQAFQLGIPLTVSITPIEFSGGYRFRRVATRLIPYAGGGIGTYGYDESSPSSAAGENLSARHVGYLAVGGVEGRVQKWISLAGDIQYTHVPGILGSSGVSHDANEHDLGGFAVRAKVIVGR